MEALAQTIKICDNCKADLKDKEKKGQSIKAILSHPSDSTKTMSLHFCSERCLRKKLIQRAATKRSQAVECFLELDITKK
jgi:hypothetical protein